MNLEKSIFSAQFQLIWGSNLQFYPLWHPPPTTDRVNKSKFSASIIDQWCKHFWFELLKELNELNFKFNYCSCRDFLDKMIEDNTHWLIFINIVVIYFETLQSFIIQTVRIVNGG